MQAKEWREREKKNNYEIDRTHTLTQESTVRRTRELQFRTFAHTSQFDTYIQYIATKWISLDDFDEKPHRERG